MSNLNWNLQITQLEYRRPSNITLQVTILPSDQTDTIVGANLWRLGIFFSKATNGQGLRHRYDQQILPQEYADWPLAPRQPLLFLDVTTLIDVTGLGCNAWRYVCIEFAKGANPIPDFELPLPGGRDAAVSCREFPCTGGHLPQGNCVHIQDTNCSWQCLFSSNTLKLVHSLLHLRCSKLQWSYFRLCADYCIAVLQGRELEVQCVTWSCGRYIGTAAVLQYTMNAASQSTCWSITVCRVWDTYAGCQVVGAQFTQSSTSITCCSKGLVVCKGTEGHSFQKILQTWADSDISLPCTCNNYFGSSNSIRNKLVKDHEEYGLIKLLWFGFVP